MSWSSHIQTASNKSAKVLNFIKRNLYNCPPDMKRTAYLTLVRPIMEYAAPVWEPYYKAITMRQLVSHQLLIEEHVWADGFPHYLIIFIRN